MLLQPHPGMFFYCQQDVLSGSTVPFVSTEGAAERQGRVVPILLFSDHSVDM
jgi:hypothetical protein